MGKNEIAGVTAEQMRLIDISNELLDLSVMLERAQSVMRNLVSDYFGDSKEEHEKSRGTWLLYNYDDARIFSGIANDYVYGAVQFVDRLMESINALIDQAKSENQ